MGRELYLQVVQLNSIEAELDRLGRRYIETRVTGLLIKQHALALDLSRRWQALADRLIGQPKIEEDALPWLS